MKHVLFICLIGAALNVFVQNEKRPIQDELARLDSQVIRIVDELDAGPRDDYFERSEKASWGAIEQLQKQSKTGQIDGLIFKSNGTVKIDVGKMPQLVPAYIAFTNIAMELSLNTQHRKVVNQLVEKGFRKESLPLLRLLKTDHPEGYFQIKKKILPETIDNHPLSYLRMPTKKQLDSSSDEDVLEFLQFQRTTIREFDKNWMTNFLKELNPHSRWVFMTVAYLNLTNGSYSLRDGFSLNHAIQYREDAEKMLRRKGGEQ